MVTSDAERERIRRTEAEAFDHLVAERGDFNPFSDAGWAVIARRYHEAVGEHPDGAMLDIGCGTGQSRQLYRNAVARYTGVDLSSAAVAMARQRFPGDMFVVADACVLPFADCSFDVIAFSSVLHHIPHFDEALREAFRVLKPGGSVFAFDPNLLHPAMLLFRWPRSPFYSAEGVSPNESPLLARDLRRAFRDAGFVDITQRAQSGIAYRAVAPRLMNQLLGLYNLLDATWQRVGLGDHLGTFVITAARKPRDA